MRPDIDDYFMEMAGLASERSTCVRRHVGCVLVNARNHVLATGYNGVARGEQHCNHATSVGGRLHFPFACSGSSTTASGTNLDACNAIHAEQNAILQCGDVHQVDRAYVTAFPCSTCSKLLLNTSCREIVFAEEYGDSVGRSLWIASGRLARQHRGEPHMIQADLLRLFGTDELCKWRIYVACVCLNLCAARVARPIVFRILERWPTPAELSLAGEDLEALLQRLGLQNRRASHLRTMSLQWGEGRPHEELPGVGRYALESAAVFCDGETNLTNIGDRKVAAWARWVNQLKSAE